MQYCRLSLLLGFVMILFSCKKDQGPTAVNTPGPTTPARHILLKDIVVPHLPSPYYRFEYNSDSLVSKVDFASGYSTYDVFYAENKISELRNKIVVNHDTLRYLYDPTGRLFMIEFINQSNIVYRHVSFVFNGDQIKEIDWDIKEGNIGFFIDRKITFEFYPDNNLKTMVDQRPSTNGSPEHTNTTLFEQYDKKSM